MQMVEITYNGNKKEFEKGTLYYEIAQSFHVDNAIAVKMGNEVISLDSKVLNNGDIEFLNVTSLSGYKIYQAALKFLFLVAVKELFPNSDVQFLHSVPKGILSEIEVDQNLTSEDISQIKGKMAEMVEQKLQFQKYNLDVKDAYI